MERKKNCCLTHTSVLYLNRNVTLTKPSNLPELRGFSMFFFVCFTLCSTTFALPVRCFFLVPSTRRCVTPPRYIQRLWFWVVAVCFFYSGELIDTISVAAKAFFFSNVRKQWAQGCCMNVRHLHHCVKQLWQTRSKKSKMVCGMKQVSLSSRLCLDRVRF